MARQDTLIQFKQGASKGISTFSEDVELINQYPIFTPGGRSEAMLHPISGSVKLLDVTPNNGSGCRGYWRSSTGPDNVGVIYTVFGDTLYRYNRYGSMIKIGNIQNYIKNISFAENQDQSLTNNIGYICDNTKIYQWNLRASDDAVAASFREIPMLPFVNGSSNEYAIPSYITYSNYRLIMTCANSNQWYYSEINSSEFTQINFETTERSPDKTQRVIAFANNLWAFSTYTYDIFSYTGSSTDPYDSAPSATGKIGIRSVDSLATYGDYLFWLGQGESANDGLYMADAGGNISRISSPFIETILRKWNSSDTAKGFAYSENGMTFYVITSRFDNQTLVYNVETKQYHLRSTSNNGTIKYWDITGVMRGYGNDLLAFTNDKNYLCKLNPDICIDHNNYPISREWKSNVFINNLDMFKVLELKIDCDVGTSKDPNIEPQVYLQLSWNGGYLWKDRMLKSLGKLGNYKKQVAFYGCGAGRNLVIRMGTSSSVPVNFYQLRLVAEGASRT